MLRVRWSLCMALVIMCQQTELCAAPGFKDGMEQAQDEAGKQATVLDVETMVRKASDAAATLRLPENAHTKEGQEKAQKAKELFDSPAFQAQLQCQQTFIKGGLEDKKVKDTGKETGQLTPSESVYLFLSSSMPEAVVNSYLVNLASANDNRLIPVMYGFLNGLADRNSSARYFNQVMKEDMRCEDKPGNTCRRLPLSIRINASLFKQYQIIEVPALVYDNGQDSWAIQGDAELGYSTRKNQPGGEESCSHQAQCRYTRWAMNQAISDRPSAGKTPATPGYVEVICIVLVIVLGALFAYDRYLVPKVKVADLKGYLQEQKALLTAGTITEDQWKRNLDTLEQVFREQPERHLIILKDVVLHHDPNAEINLK